VDMGPAEGGATTGVLASTRGRCGRSKQATAGLLIFGGGVTARGGSSGFQQAPECVLARGGRHCFSGSLERRRARLVAVGAYHGRCSCEEERTRLGRGRR
jgi:hypothetical protein